ncbi:isochorismatase family protein [Hahella sp. NBU794]|uniref:isochorismatase family protein n=1 Tax=Hahella sp. NBU794 TaxID=3422590 RepID=UPI003D6ED547
MAIPKIADYSLANASALPSNKTDWTIDPSRAVLLVHDMQRYFVNFYNLDGEPMGPLLANIQTLKAACKKAGVPVVYTAQPGDQTPEDRALLTDFWGTGLAADPNLTDIVAELEPEGDDIEYVKWRYSAFKRTPLLDYMRENGKDQLIICGVYAHIGVLATSLEAFMLDIKPFVVADAVADFSEQEQKMALNYVAQRCGHVDALEVVLAALNGATANAAPSTAEPLSLEALRRDVAAILMMSPEDVDPEENLMYMGLDSIRVMSLLENWRARGADITFVDLAESLTINEWWRTIEPRLTTEA